MKRFLITLTLLLSSSIACFAQFGPAQLVHNGMLFPEVGFYTRFVDFNGDGLADLYMPTDGNELVQAGTYIRYALPGGGFSASSIRLPTAVSGFLRIDNDSLLDYYSAEFGANPRKYLLFRNTGGGFVLADSILTQWEPTAFYDRDQDGDDDAFVVNTNWVKMHENEGGHFAAALLIPHSASRPISFDFVNLTAHPEPEMVVYGATTQILVKDTASHYSVLQAINYASSQVTFLPRLNPWVDVNGDGIPDYCSRNSFLLSGPDGLFRPVMQTVPIYQEFEGDLDRDGKPDLIGRVSYFDSVGILRADSAGRVYYLTKTIPLPRGGSQLTDLDGDGYLDLVFIQNRLEWHPGLTYLNWRRGLPGNRFGPVRRFANQVDCMPTALESDRPSKQGELLRATDYQGREGYLMVTGNSIVFKAGQGQDLVFPSPMGQDSLPVTNWFGQLTDMNADGKADAVVFAQSEIYWVELRAGAQPNRLSLVRQYNPNSVMTANALADVNGDALPDYIFQKGQFQYDSVFVALGQTGGGFQSPVYSGVRLGPNNPYKPEARYWVKDFNSDGFADLLLGMEGGMSSANWRSFSIAYGNGQGMFGQPEPTFSRIYAKANALFGKPGLIDDWDGDGQPDAIAGDTLGRLMFYEALGMGAYSAQLLAQEGAILPAPETTPYIQNHLAVNDFNQDGKPDALVIPQESSLPIRLIISNSTGPYSLILNPLPGLPTNLNWYNHGVTSGDINGDGYPDVLFQKNGLSYVFLNQIPTQTKEAVTPASIKLHLYPNPARDAVHVSGPAHARIQVQSALGTPVAELVLDGAGKGQLRTGSFSAGVYLVRSGSTVQRLILER